MTWLTLWLKKIILLVLLAAFLDLILPNTTLQRYVKMVMGLILLLTIISPVFSLFSLSQDELALRLDRYQQELNKPAAVEWKRVTDKLLGQQDEQVTDYVQSQIETAVKARVKEEYGLDVQRVVIKVNNQDPSQPSIERIELTLGETGQETTHAVAPIQPIAPVSIQIGESPNVTDSRIDIEAASRTQNPTYVKIADDIAKQWGLASDQVVVKDESRQRERQ
ncbi:stage III sporulation protein AF [Brevibacillus choshinensis]|uniref:Stage III sporulation protein AF n=1 Tax=Brevibacillus choshinensis TaxID=54911 RepID=A0ABX7FVP3_BRECH|nr:stage III sporulation protein AF [Brevibacillus choshinensis]QRG69788.1 stage III sporulation protein AF [Brevibacillus choshinensis]